MNEIQLLLNNIFQCLKRANSPLVNLLNEGIGKDYINAQLEKYDLEFPGDVYSLYEWKNGVDDSQRHLMGNICLFTMGIFPPFHRAYKSYQELVQNDDYWTKSMFPLFESGGAGFHLLECNPASDNFGMIYFYDIGAYEFDTIIGKYDTIETLFKSVNECYERGIYTYDNEGKFTVTDYDRSFEISRKYNPHCRDYWSLFF
jgi:hypothetical protein